MRILHVSTSDTAGGAARAAFRLHTGLKRLGHHSKMYVAAQHSTDSDITRFFPTHDLVARLRRKIQRRSIDHDFAPYKNHLPPRYELFSDDRTEHGVDMARKTPACDIVNLHWIAGFLDHQPFFTEFATHRPHVPIVWRLADMNALTGGCHYDQGCGKFTARCGACPELGSSNEHDLSRDVWNRKDQSFRAIDPKRMHLVATSRWIAGEAKRSSLLGRFDVTIIPNGLDTEVFKPRDRGFSRDLLGIPQDGRVILFAADSTAQRRKGFAELAAAIEGIQNLDNLTFVSVGGGKPGLKSPHRHVHLGRLNDDRLLSMAYSAADIFVIPSLQESFGQTVIESMACGTPVVGFASGGIPDMVRPGVTGALAPTGDVPALRDAIVRVLSDDQALKTMAENCRKIATDEYSMETQARAYAELYQTLIARNAS